MKKNKQMEARYNWLDVAKGIAILLIVYGHVSRGFLDSGLIAGTTLLRQIDGIIYSFHVPLFFFVSGLLFKKLNYVGEMGQLIAKKFKRLVIPYFIFTLITGLFRIALSKYVNVHVDSSFVYKMFISPQFQFWFLYDLFFFILLLALLTLVLDRHILIIGLLIKFILPQINNTFWILGDVSAYFIFFCMGYVFKDLFLSGKAIELKWSVIPLASYAVASMAPNIITNTIASFSLVWLTLILSNLIQASDRLFTILGRESMPIYLMHVMIASTLRIILVRLSSDYLIIFMLSLAASVVIPIVATHIMDRFHIKFVIGG